MGRSISPMEEEPVAGSDPRAAPRLIVPMSLQLVIPRRVALQQSSPPLHQPRVILKEKRKFEKEEPLNCMCANSKLSQQKGSPQQSVPTVCHNSSRQRGLLKRTTADCRPAERRCFASLLGQPCVPAVCRISGAASIETQGVLAQLLVSEVHDCKKVMAGERRLRAGKLAALHATIGLLQNARIRVRISQPLLCRVPHAAAVF